MSSKLVSYQQSAQSGDQRPNAIRFNRQGPVNDVDKDRIVKETLAAEDDDYYDDYLLGQRNKSAPEKLSIIHQKVREERDQNESRNDSRSGSRNEVTRVENQHRNRRQGEHPGDRTRLNALDRQNGRWRGCCVIS